MQIRDRVRELKRVMASELRPSPSNWRVHPQGQQDALRGVLSEIGYAGALLARELPDGTLELIDGHLRAETTPDMEVPVLVLDVDEREAKYLLATLDPLGAMAEANDEALAALLADVESENAAVQEMLEGVTNEDHPAKIVPFDVRPPPSMAWALIGIATSRLAEVQDQLDSIAKIEGVFCEVALNAAD